MKDFLVLLREPDGRKFVPSESFQREHQEHWKIWLEKMMSAGALTSGRPLTMQGSLVMNSGKKITPGPHRSGEEIVGGFLTIRAADLKQAEEYISDCPVFESAGYAEIREIM